MGLTSVHSTKIHRRCRVFGGNHTNIKLDSRQQLTEMTENTKNLL